MIYLHLDLADLNSVRAAAEEFKSRETKLHVLFNNAAVQALGDTDTISHTVQGHEIHLGVNLLGPFLFTKLLTQKLLDTVKAEPADSGIVRVVWVSSLGTEVVGEKSYGLTTNYLDYHTTMSPLERYGMTKAGNWLHAVEFARRHRDDGIISMPCNPGHLKTDLYRDGGQMAKAVLSTIALYAPIFGAYTELYCATSPDITLQQSGDWGKSGFARLSSSPLSIKGIRYANPECLSGPVIPWGRFNPIRADLLEATKSEVEGGNGNAQKFWEWCEKQIAEFL